MRSRRKRQSLSARLALSLCVALAASATTPAQALAAPVTDLVHEASAAIGQHAADASGRSLASALLGLCALAPATSPFLKGKDSTGDAPSVRLIDAQTNEATPQGDATLEGARVCALDADGNLVATMVTGADGTASLTPVAKLEAGTYHIVCSKAPTGYANNLRWGKDVTVTSDHTIVDTEDLTCPLSPLAASMIFAVVDADTGKAEPQGDATLEGAEFTITNKSANPVWYGGKNHQSGEVVTTIATGADGECTLPEDLAYGTYEATNTKAPVGYTLDGSYAQEVTVDGSHSVLDATGSGKVRDKGTVPVEGAKPARLKLVCGTVTVAKADADTGQTKPSGAATLEGATFEIAYAGTNRVTVGGKEVATGDVALTVTTDEDGVAQTADGALPYGKWTIRETKAPEGYLADNAWSETVEIETSGQTVDVTCRDKVQRGDLHFHKVTLDGKPLANVAFKVTSDTTGESHIAVTDDEGYLTSASKDRPHTKETNGCDQALKEDGTLDESVLDATRGIWFSGSKDAASEPSDSRGALPFDTYTVEELASSANAGLRLRTLHVRVDQDGCDLDLGSVADEPLESIATRLSVTSVTDDGTVNLTDEVTCDGLVQGATYTLTGTLHVRGEAGTDEGELKGAGGKAHTATVTFEATDRHMVVPVALTVDRVVMADRVVVCFEVLTDADGKAVASHADIADDAQSARLESVEPVRIETSLTDSSGLHALFAMPETNLYDRVNYTGLEAGATYNLTAKLVDKATGVALEGTDGRPLTFGREFVAEAADGSTTVRMTIDATGMEGRSLVCFERLERDGEPVCAHEDLTDEGQTVRFCKISTKARLEGIISSEARIVDTVTYENLVVGECYLMRATLHDPDSGKEVPYANGCAYFIPKEENGTVEVEVPFDTTDYEGRSVVVFEALTDFMSETVLATHADPDDPDQTVRFPSIDTLATSEAGTKWVQAKEDTLIRDRVTYAGLEPGIELTLVGYLYDQETAEPVRDADDNEISATCTFVAEDTDGEVTNEFSLDTSGLEGMAIVCVEELYDAQGTLVAEHYDLSDEDQIVRVASIATMLTDEEGADQLGYACAERTLTDLVRHKGLTPGLTYQLVGTLFDRDTEQPVTDAKGDPYIAATDFTPQTAEGLTTVTFQVDGDLLQGRDVVAFEQVLFEGDEVASHADLFDPSQTVSYPSLETEATCGESHVFELGDEQAVTITDDILYSHVVAGLPYTVEGTLVDAITGEEIEGGHATGSFIATNSCDFFAMTFDVAADAVRGRTVACLEYLYEDGVLVAAHADVEDTYQQVTFTGKATSGIDTTFHAKGSASHDVVASKTTVLVDTVDLTDLEAGATYTLITRVVDAETGHALPILPDEDADRDVWVEGDTYHLDRACASVRDAKGLVRSGLSKAIADGAHACDAEDAPKALTELRQTLTATSEHMTVDVGVTLDTTEAANRELVAFERLERAGQVACTHEDHNDDDQTVTVGNVPTEPEKPATTIPTTGTTTPTATDTKGATTPTPATGAATPATGTTTPASLAKTGDSSERLASVAVTLVGLGVAVIALAARSRRNR